MKEVFGIKLPDNDEHFQSMMELSGAGTYQIDKLDAAVKLCKNYDLAIDVGAHVGFWSKELSPIFSRVIAFEPVPENIECFIENIKGKDNVNLYNYGLGALDSIVRIKTDEKNSGLAHVSDDGIKVKILRLDSLSLISPIDFMKIDVEGYESFVIRGARETIQRDKPVIVVEQKFSDRYGLSELDGVHLLEGWGYEIVWVKSGDYCLINVH